MNDFIFLIVYADCWCDGRVMMNKDETKTAEFAENERRIKDLELVCFSCVCDLGACFLSFSWLLISPL